MCGRTLRVDHVEQYKIPKDPDKLDQEALLILQEGCGPNSSVIKTLQAPKPAAPPPLSPKLSIKKEKEGLKTAWILPIILLVTIGSSFFYY